MANTRDKADMIYLTPEHLFHTTLTVVNYNEDSTGANQSFHVLGTHGTLEAAKAFASGALTKLNYSPDEFSEYSERLSSPAEKWTHRDGVVLFARAPAGQELSVGIDTTPNNESLAATADGTICLSTDGPKLLHYVVQTTIDYNTDRTGSVQERDIEGCYVKRTDALVAARECLQAQPFATCDIRDSEDMCGQWPYGEDVVVHAVTATGQNYIVSVLTDPWARMKGHGKKWSGLW